MKEKVNLKQAFRPSLEKVVLTVIFMVVYLFFLGYCSSFSGSDGGETLYTCGESLYSTLAFLSKNVLFWLLSIAILYIVASLIVHASRRKNK